MGGGGKDCNGGQVRGGEYVAYFQTKVRGIMSKDGKEVWHIWEE